MCLIENLHLGMNLRDAGLFFKEGETAESLGCEFGVLGQVTPMREDLLAWTLAATIVDAKVSYVGQTQYLFTTHSDGLRVTYGSTTTLLDSSFTGPFCILPINDEYFVLSNGSISRKWKPGWSQAYQWGLNTPPQPTAAKSTVSDKTIADFEDLYYWVQAGGGASGALAADTTHYTEGTQSMQLTCSAATVCTGTLETSLDLSEISASVGVGTNAYIGVDYYSVDLAYVRRITFKMSCAADKGFDKDYFVYTVEIPSTEQSTILDPQYGKANEATENQPDTTWVQNLPFDVSNQYDRSFTSVEEQALYNFSVPVDDNWRVGQETTVQTLTTYKPETRVKSETGSWTQLKIPTASWQRVGSTSGRGWDTITAIRIELEAQTEDAEVSFDNWRIVRGQTSGTYYFAVAYENELGNYGPYSEFSEAIATTGEPIAIGNLTPDTDGQTTKRRVVVIGGSLTEFFVFTIDDNTSTSYDYDLDDSELTEVETNFHNRPPPACTDMVEANGRIFLVGVDGFPHHMVYSNELFYEAFPYANYRVVTEGEDLKQVAKLGDYLAARGKHREHLFLLTSSDPASWSQRPGAREGAVTQKLLLELEGTQQVYASKKGLYTSSLGGGDGFYLEKINPAIDSDSMDDVIGAMAGKKAYLSFTDTDGTARVMRIDYSHGFPLAHYVRNFTPAAIFADQILGKVYYASGIYIYEFDSGDNPLSIKIVLPLWCKNKQVKDWSKLIYQLSGGPLTLSWARDGTAVSGSLSLDEAVGESDPQTLPLGTTARELEITLESTDQDFTLKLPWEFEEVPIAS
jgi:hypothetical protein